MKIPSAAINNPQFTFILILLLALVGIASFFTMPRSEDPQFDMPLTLIEVVYPGASPLDVENLVVDPLEEAINELENIKRIESQVKNGGVRLEVEFIYGSEPDDAYDRVKQAVSGVESSLPAGIQEISVIKATPRSVAILQLALSSDNADYKRMEFFAKQLEKRLEAFPNVQKADLWGYPQQIVSIDVDNRLLKHYGISVNQVTDVLQGRSLNITPGFVDAGERRFNIKASGNFTNLEQLNDTIVHSSDNFALKLSDVAMVSFANLQPSYLAYYHNKPVIFITIEQRKDSNIFALGEQLNTEIDAFSNRLPKDLKLETVFTQLESVEKRVDGFFENLVQGLIIVGIMSLLFLGVKESLIVMLAIPLSFMIALGWLDMAGFGLQQMSIVGLIIALGLLVDNAIVVTENINRSASKDLTAKQAALKGVAEVGWPITSGTATTLLAFLPLLMLNSDTGDFMRSLPVTVIFVLLASLIIALTLTPMLASQLFKPSDKKSKNLQYYSNKFADNIYVPIISRLLRFKTVVLLLGLLTLGGLGFLFTQVGVSFFPKAEKPMLLIDIETQPNSSLFYTRSVMEEIANTIQTKPTVKTIALNVGNANPRLYYNEVPKRGVSNFGQMLVVLDDYQAEKVNQLVTQLRASYSDYAKAKVSIREFTQGPVTDQPISFRILGDSINDIRRVAMDLERKMVSTNGIVNINNPIGQPNIELALDINYDKAALAKVSINSLDSTVKTLLSGTVVGQFNDENGEDYPIVIRRNSTELESLSDIYITNTIGQQIPLENLVTLRLIEGNAEFYHYQKLRMAKVSADVATGYSVVNLTQVLVGFMENYDLPDGVHFDVGGEEQNRQQSFAGLTQVMIIAVVGIFAVLVLQFKSFLQPVVVFSAIPFAVLGSVLGLYLFDMSFSIMAFIGLISLFGIVVNDAIILIDASNRFQAQGIAKYEAVIQASASRFTPIILTTLTTIGGLIPLTLWGGSLWQPLGLVIISGLCASTITCLVIVPILTVICTRQSQQSAS